MAMSPPVIRLERASASLVNSALPGSAAAPARPTPFKNERRPTTRSQWACTSSSTDAEGSASDPVIAEVSLDMGHPSLLGIELLIERCLTSPYFRLRELRLRR